MIAKKLPPFIAADIYINVALARGTGYECKTSDGEHCPCTDLAPVTASARPDIPKYFGPELLQCMQRKQNRSHKSQLSFRRRRTRSTDAQDALSSTNEVPSALSALCEWPQKMHGSLLYCLIGRYPISRNDTFINMFANNVLLHPSPTQTAYSQHHVARINSHSLRVCQKGATSFNVFVVKFTACKRPMTRHFVLYQALFILFF